jgi:Flp pilus assembly protein protease CpaA
LILNPTLPIVSPPVVNPIIQTFVAENIIASDVLLLIFKMIMVVVASIVVGLLLNKSMDKKGFVTNKAFTLIASTAIALGLSLRFGMSVYTFQGMFLFFLLLYASMSDLTDRHVANHISISILALSLISVPTVGFTSMLIGGAVSAAIQLGVTALSGGGYGGADWKISSACAFLLGWQRGLAGMVLGLLIGVIFTLAYNKIKDRDIHEGFALVPFISIGMLAVFFI